MLTASPIQAADVETPPGRAVPVDGRPFEARLVEANAQWRFTFDDGKSPRTLPAEEIVRWGTPAEPARGPVVVLANGGLLPAELSRIDDGHVVLESDSFGTRRAALESLAGVILAWPGNRAEQDRLIDRLLQAKDASDRVFLVNGDQLDGIVTSIDPKWIRIESNGKSTRLPRRRAGTVCFNSALREESTETSLRAWVGLADGTRLLVDRLRLDGSTLRLTPSGVGPIASPWSTQAPRCVFVQPVGGRAVYLSDRTADGYRHVPFLGLPWRHHNDRNVLGLRLRAGGQTHLKGLGVHSRARLTYLLGEPFARFDADLAIDDAAGGGGSVRYHVFVDRRRRFSSEPIRGGDRPVPVRVELTGAERLDLVVDFGERADQLDYADWLDARLVRPKKPADKPRQQSATQEP